MPRRNDKARSLWARGGRRPRFSDLHIDVEWMKERDEVDDDGRRVGPGDAGGPTPSAPSQSRSSAMSRSLRERYDA
jgi:hypothetical protein